MKKAGGIIISSLAAVAFMYFAHRARITLKEWSLLAICVPVTLAGLRHRVTGASVAMFALIVALGPLVVQKYAERPRLAVDMTAGLLTAGFSAIYVSHVLRKDAKSGAAIERIQDILGEMHANGDENTLINTARRLFRESSGFAEVEVYTYDENGLLKRHGGGDPLPDEHLYHHVARTGMFLASDSTATDPRLRVSGGGDYRLAVFPLNYGGRPRGVVAALDTGAERIEKEEIDFLLSLLQALEAALEILENRAAAISHEMRREKIKDTLSSYINKSLAAQMAGAPDELGLTGKLIHTTVMFTRIANFNELQSAVPPEELFDMLNEYFSKCIELVLARDGVIDKFIGDKVMACWGAPLPVREPEKKAAACAKEIIAAVEILNSRWAQTGKPAFDVRIGLNSGPAVAGNIGSAQRMEYTVIGDTVNTAARIAAIDAPGNSKILAGEALYEKIKNNYSTSSSFTVELKGKAAEINIFAF